MRGAGTGGATIVSNYFQVGLIVKAFTANVNTAFAPMNYTGGGAALLTAAQSALRIPVASRCISMNVNTSANAKDGDTVLSILPLAGDTGQTNAITILAGNTGAQTTTASNPTISPAGTRYEWKVDTSASSANSITFAAVAWFQVV